MEKLVEQANALAAATLIETAKDPDIDDLLRINLQTNAAKLAGSAIESLPESLLPDFVVESTLADWSYTKGSKPRAYTACAGNAEWGCEIEDADTKSELALLAEIKARAVVGFSITQAKAIGELFKKQRTEGEA